MAKRSGHSWAWGCGRIKMSPNPSLTNSKFEDYLEIINIELAKKRWMWQLKAIPWMNYEDVEQIIRFHIFNLLLKTEIKIDTHLKLLDLLFLRIK